MSGNGDQKENAVNQLKKPEFVKKNNTHVK